MKQNVITKYKANFADCPIKVSFTDCPVEDRKYFYKSNCIMPISVGLGLTVHEGNKFLGTLKLINSAFNCFTILLDDSIQRYTMRILSNSSDEEIYAKAIREGDLWLERNSCILELSTIPYNIKRWDDWLNHSDYQNSREIIDKLYKTDHEYRSAIEETIKEFLVRFKKNIKEEDLYKFNHDYAYESCLLYLKEECSVMCLWAKESYDFEVYPTGRNKAMIATYNKIIAPNTNYLKSVSLHFKKYKNIMNQNQEIYAIHANHLSQKLYN